MATKAAKKLEFEIVRVKPGSGNKNWWLVWSDTERQQYCGSFWFNGGKWNAQYSLTHASIKGHPVRRFDAPAECIAYLIEREIVPEQLAGLDISLVG